SSTTSKRCFELTSSVSSTTSKRCFEHHAASFLVCSLIFIECKKQMSLCFLFMDYKCSSETTFKDIIIQKSFLKLKSIILHCIESVLEMRYNKFANTYKK
ncbi:hypothetical protein, partial [Streptococcus pseudopneumoniae]|uniref:hypothetical protein n=1 Tax=Streptococcus pseudopneumoniae TaxID=257758 RepID=UPI0019D6994E